MQRGPLSPSPSDGPGARGTSYAGVHRGQGTAGQRVPAFNAGGQPITRSHAESQPPETTSSGMHREPLSSTSVAHWEGAQSPGAQAVLAMFVHRTTTHTPQVLEPEKDPHRELPATHRSWAPTSQPSPLHRHPTDNAAKPSLVKRERRNQALAREAPWFPQRTQWKTSKGPGSSSGQGGCADRAGTELGRSRKGPRAACMASTAAFQCAGSYRGPAGLSAVYHSMTPMWDGCGCGVSLCLLGDLGRQGTPGPTSG
ncbi:hypothetical protein H8957_003546 [Semnopithecus entellus]